MPTLLDTNVAIHLRDGDVAVTSKIRATAEPLLLSIVTRIELEGGVYRDPAQSGVRRARLDAILSSIPVLDFDEVSADAYRMIVQTAGYSRRKLLDRMIAAQALAHHATLATLNLADFTDIPGLQLLAW
ncbi:MAG TPA: type II toxin-antitoxin system VapC family toxin [Caulobacteraceae bacterium]